MKRIYLLAAMMGMLVLTSCYRETVIVPDYQVTEYTFVEDFNNNKNKWAFNDPTNYAYGEVSQGTFKFEYLDDYYQAYYRTVDPGFNPNDDFLVEARIGSDNMMGIIFGQNYYRERYGYSFTVDYDGYFALYDEGGNGFGLDIQEIIPPTYTNAINKYGDWNTVTIKQSGNIWIGYINDYEVFRIEAQPLYGNGFGFVVVPWTIGEADYIDAIWYR